MQNKFSLFILFFSCLILKVNGQETDPIIENEETEKRLVKLTGVIISKIDTMAVSGAHIIIPAANTGTVATQAGFFDINVYTGDSIVFSSVGFKKAHFVVPTDNEKEVITIIVEMVTDTTMLAIVDIYPFPVGEAFDEAFLSIETPNPENNPLNKTLADKTIAQMFRDAPMSAEDNHQYFLNLHANKTANRFQLNDWRYANPLMNPLAWKSFIGSIKRGDFKKSDLPKSVYKNNSSFDPSE